MSPKKFQGILWKYHKTHRRNLPWRKTKNPYHILVSEIMLQQTQVERVIPKYEEFIKKFPNIETLAKAPLKEVLGIWKGLGYNRRALNLKRSAEIITSNFAGKIPKSLEELKTLPGIGSYTAGAVLTFAYNQPEVFIETNIRTVYTYFFFSTKKSVDDKEILGIVKKTIDLKKPREWYYALMDYGSMLKKKGIRINSQSLHYSKQSAFKGSNREVRSKILQYILKNDSVLPETLLNALKIKSELITKNLIALEKEKFIKIYKGLIKLAD